MIDTGCDVDGSIDDCADGYDRKGGFDVIFTGADGDACVDSVCLNGCTYDTDNESVSLKIFRGFCWMV